MLSQKQREWMALRWIEETRALLVRARQLGNDIEYVDQVHSRMRELEGQGLLAFRIGHTMLSEDPGLVDRLANAAGLTGYDKKAGP